MDYSIGVDVGGTKVALAIVDQTGTITEASIIPTDLTITAEAMIDRINLEIINLIDQSSITKEQLVGIGVGTPGPLDSKNGMITCPPNLTNWKIGRAHV